jgi:hypothetical protein
MAPTLVAIIAPVMIAELVKASDRGDDTSSVAPITDFVTFEAYGRSNSKG